MIQLAVALGTVTIVAVTGVKGILGLGPAVFLIAGALAVGPAGRLSDRVGRMPVIRGGFVLGIVGPLVTAAGCAATSRRARLPRARPLRRGAVDRAALARRRGRDVPARAARPRHVDRALRRRLGRDLGAARLRPDVRRPRADAARPRLCRGSRPPRFTLGGLLVSFGVRPDPKELSPRLRGGRARRRPPAPLREILRRPGVSTAIVAAVASFARDDRRDEPRRLRRGRPRPLARVDLHRDQHPHRRHVRARAGDRRSDRPDRQAQVDGDRADADGRVERGPRLSSPRSRA